MPTSKNILKYVDHEKKLAMNLFNFQEILNIDIQI